MGRGRPFLQNDDVLIAAGIDPKTHLPVKGSKRDARYLQNEMLRVFRVIDRTDACRRYTWYNLPNGLDGELIERILYYRGRGMFFYMETDDKFYFLPYSLEGEVDVYGRYQHVTPLPFAGGKTDDNGKQRPWIPGLVREPAYEMKTELITADDLRNKCVLLNDYCKDISQTTLPRQQLNEPILNVMSETVPFLRTSLILSTGVRGMRVQDPDEQQNVDAAASSILDSALTGEPFVSIVGSVEFQELGANSTGKSDEFLLALQSLDNMRLSTYGIDNGGLFQKKQTITDTQAALNGGPVGLVYQDGLILRQNFCDIVNSYFALGIWCDASEPVMGFDRNMDGNPYDTTTASVGNGSDTQEATDDSDV